MHTVYISGVHFTPVAGACTDIVGTCIAVRRSDTINFMGALFNNYARWEDRPTANYNYIGG